MAADIQHKHISYTLSESEHKYGKNVHILSDPFLISHLTRLCMKTTIQPTVNELVETIYQNLVKMVCSNEFPRKYVDIETRMIDYHKEAVISGEIIDPDTKVVSVNLARAGTFPSHVCYGALNYFLNPHHVRQDHIILSREIDEQNRVVGTNVFGSKIGGTVDNSIVMIPDPMGATGGTIIETLKMYKSAQFGKAQKFITMHLIVTPEFIKKVHSVHPDVIIYAVRLDRGLSSEKVLNSIPGTFWDEERGLNEKHYIVPGAGGLGEVLNNSYV